MSVEDFDLDDVFKDEKTEPLIDPKKPVKPKVETKKPAKKPKKKKKRGRPPKKKEEEEPEPEVEPVETKEIAQLDDGELGDDFEIELDEAEVKEEVVEQPKEETEESTESVEVGELDFEIDEEIEVEATSSESSTSNEVEVPQIPSGVEELQEAPESESESDALKFPRYRAPTEAELDAMSMQDKPDYDTSEMGILEDRTIYALIGDKGAGKTTIAFSFDKDELPVDDPRRINYFTKEPIPTRIGCLSLDKQGFKIARLYREALWDYYKEKPGLVKLRAKCKPTKDEILERKHPYEWESSLKMIEAYQKKVPEEKWGYIHTPNGVKQVKEIFVWNAVRYYFKEPATLKLKSADFNFKYMKHLLDEVIAPMELDYIVLDASFKLSSITEYVMRYRNNLTHKQGIANPNVWKDRNDFMDYIIDRVVKHSLIAPIFTFFFKMQKIKDKESGETYLKEPEWVDRIKEEANVVIHLAERTERGIRNWYGECQSPKDPGWRVDETIVYTDMVKNGGINNLLKKNEVYDRPRIEVKQDDSEEIDLEVDDL